MVWKLPDTKVNRRTKHQNFLRIVWSLEDSNITLGMPSTLADTKVIVSLVWKPSGTKVYFKMIWNLPDTLGHIGTNFT